MAERSFVKELQDSRLSGGEEFRGEGILGSSKAQLQSGVGCVGGYQDALANVMRTLQHPAWRTSAGTRFERELRKPMSTFPDHAWSN